MDCFLIADWCVFFAWLFLITRLINLTCACKAKHAGPVMHVCGYGMFWSLAWSARCSHSLTRVQQRLPQQSWPPLPTTHKILQQWLLTALPEWCGNCRFASAPINCPLPRALCSQLLDVAYDVLATWLRQQFSATRHNPLTQNKRGWAMPKREDGFIMHLIH